jgi:enterochelin esterase-like enzyme
MIRIYLILGVIAVLSGVIWYLVYQIQENAVLRSSLEGAAATIAAQAKDAALTDKLILDTVKQREVLQHELDKTKQDLHHLQRTPAQLECDRLPLPDGYVNQLLHYDPKN